MKIPYGPARKACPALGKKSSLDVFHFFSLLLSQQAEDSINHNQTLQHPGIIAHGKPPYIEPN
jgi:hypothetical protein